MAKETTSQEDKKPLPDDIEALRTEIKDLRRENAAARTKNRDLESQLAEAGKKKDDPADDQTAEKVAQLEKDLAEERHLRLKAEVAAEKGLTPAQAKRLQGQTREDLETDADDLLETLPAPAAKDDTDEEPARRGGPPSRRPKPDLRGGNDPTETPVETDPAKLAEQVPRL